MPPAPDLPGLRLPRTQGDVENAATLLARDDSLRFEDTHRSVLEGLPAQPLRGLEIGAAAEARGLQTLPCLRAASTLGSRDVDCAGAGSS